MNKLSIYLFPGLSWIKTLAGLFLLVSGTVSRAQQLSAGNTTIFGAEQMTFFGNHNFITGGSGVQPGIINTIRTSPMGILNFAGTANTVSGADDANYVDGYVRKLGTNPFIFPVGDNDHYGPFAASGDGTSGAYFFADPGKAITSKLSGGNYPVLPAGGPFPATTLNTGLAVVSTVEYWDINGANPTPITLTWDANSKVGALTGNSLPKLTIAGWDGTQWVPIPSLTDVVSVLEGASDLSAGSIKTTVSIVPDTYTAYTLAARTTPLPVKLVAFSAVKESNTILLNWSTAQEVNADIFNIERSPDAKNWIAIGSKEATGETEVLVNYEFTDIRPLSGMNYYRLKMVDIDKTFAYSSIRSVAGEKTPADLLAIYPNPVSDVIFLKDASGLSVDVDSVKGLSIINQNGITAYKSNSFSAAGVNVSNLPNGTYIVKITKADGTTSSHRILIMK